MSDCPRIVIAGTRSGVGKTTVSIGIMHALTRQGIKVQPYKTGPDYIDSSYHKQAAGLPSRNLDSWLLSQAAILELFSHSSAKADVAVIEGVMGLYDGKLGGEQLEASPAGSTAQLAKILNAPVILVLDAGKIAGSAAAIALGYRELDKDVRLAGVILNRVGSKRHYLQLKRTIEKYAKLPVLGYLPRNEALHIPERHLGLVPAEEQAHNTFGDELAKQITAGIDLESIKKIANEAGALPPFKPAVFALRTEKPKVRIGVAKDKAFSFYYQNNLDILNHLGAELIYFSPLNDQELPPDIAGLYLGGGFPEVFAEQLSRNDKLKQAVKQANADGLPIYAECGGLLYLTKGIIAGDGKQYPMVGLIEAQARMQKKRQALGYVDIKVIRDNILSKKGESLRGHEFHWSSLEGASDNNHVYELRKSQAIKPRLEGIVQDNLLASYVHLHFGSCPKLAENFICRCIAV